MQYLRGILIFSREPTNMSSLQKIVSRAVQTSFGNAPVVVEIPVVSEVVVDIPTVSDVVVKPQTVSENVANE